MEASVRPSVLRQEVASRSEYDRKLAKENAWANRMDEESRDEWVQEPAVEADLHQNVLQVPMSRASRAEPTERYLQMVLAEDLEAAV